MLLLSAGSAERVTAAGAGSSVLGPELPAERPCETYPFSCFTLWHRGHFLGGVSWPPHSKRGSPPGPPTVSHHRTLILSFRAKYHLLLLWR